MLTLLKDLTILDIPIGNSPQIVMIIVGILVFLFLLFCFIPALMTWWQLKKARTNLNQIHQGDDDTLIEVNQLYGVFEHKLFQDAWNSFKDTLHQQYEYEAGFQKLNNIRATAPAEAFFTQQTIVDSQINTEFFKHLPGILTGIGIIGTFWGLIHGIQSFDPSLLAKARLDPAQMDSLFNGLQKLFIEVQGAFIASAVAIACAMIVTLIEKFSINACYYRLEQLCLKLDSLYEGGVTEVYLEALVKSSAENVTHTAQLKASLVTESSELLRNLTDAQIKAQEEQTKIQIEQSDFFARTLVGKIQEQIEATANHAQQQIEETATHGELFRTELKNGLELMGAQVANVAGGQGDNVTRMLEQLIGKFSETITNTFNGQMVEVGKMIEDSANSMKEMQGEFKGLITNLKTAGEKERETVNTEMAALAKLIAEQQTAMQSQLTAFINSTNDQIINGQNNSQQKTEKILEALDKERKASFESERQMIIDMKTQVSTLAANVAETMAALKENTKVLSSTSLTSINKMTEGAERISAATNNLASAGDKVIGVLGQTEKLSNQLMTTGSQMSSASNVLKGQLEEYTATRELLSRMITDMKVMLERAKQEAGMNQQIVTDMQKMVGSFGILKDDMDDFTTNVSKLLAETNKQFHTHHADTLRQVANAYQPLAATITGLVDMVARNNNRGA